MEPHPEQDTDALTFLRKLDPLKGVGVVAVLVEAASG
jgi:hypothetical protein